MSEWTIYHNPECSKSRAAMAYLDERGVEARVVEYLKQPLDAEELAETLRKLNLKPRDILRDGEDEYEALGLNDPSLSDAELLKAVAANPALMQRPIIVRDGRAVVGRPTEAIDDLLD